MTIKRCYPVLVGASVVENQLASVSGMSAQTSSGVTFTTNSDGSYTITGTATGRVQTPSNAFARFTITNNHKYAVIISSSIGKLTVRFASGLSENLIRQSTIVNCTADTNAYVSFDSAVAITDTFSISNLYISFIDLTQMLGSTIANYVYSLEQATAGSGIAWLRSYGFLTDDYVPYNAGSIESVEATAKVVIDENGENDVTYPLGNDVLRGIFKLDANNQLYADGDRKTADGTITRYYGIRAYQSGDESLTDSITDGTNTVYKLTTPTTEQSTPFTTPQIVYPDGTEEFITENNVPVGNETEYQL